MVISMPILLPVAKVQGTAEHRDTAILFPMRARLVFLLMHLILSESCVIPSSSRVQTLKDLTRSVTAMAVASSIVQVCRVQVCQGAERNSVDVFDEEWLLEVLKELLKDIRELLKALRSSGLLHSSSSNTLMSLGRYPPAAATALAQKKREPIPDTAA